MVSSIGLNSCSALRMGSEKVDFLVEEVKSFLCSLIIISTLPFLSKSPIHFRLVKFVNQLAFTYCFYYFLHSSSCSSVTPSSFRTSWRSSSGRYIVHLSASIVVTCSPHSLFLLSTHSLIGWIPQKSPICQVFFFLFSFYRLFSLVFSYPLLPILSVFFMIPLLFLMHTCMSLYGVQFLSFSEG